MTSIPILVSHRGFRKGVVENTFQAFDESVRNNMDYIELDVHLTRDNRLVVIHDKTIDRIFNGKGNVNDYDYKELSTFRSTEGDQSIPLLENVIHGYITNIKLMIELKGDDTAIPVAHMVNKEHIVEQVVVSSRNLDLLTEAEAHIDNETLVTCLNITSCKSFSVEQLLSTERAGDLPMPFSMISLKSTLVEQEYIDKCHHLGLKAFCWDFLSPENPVEYALELRESGMDGFLLDDPGMVSEFRKKLGMKN